MGARCFLGIAVLLCVTGCSRDPESQKTTYFETGREFEGQGRIAEAITEYRKAVTVDQHFAEARVKLADIYERHGDLRGAYGELVRASDSRPNDADLHVRVGKMMLLAGQTADARTRAERALSLQPRHVRAQVLLANALAGLKDMDGAVKEMQEAIELDPDEGRTFANLGVIELARGHNADAEAAFKRAVELSPHEAGAQLALANFYWATGRPREAEIHLKKSADLDPRNVDVNHALGLFYTTQGRLPEAEQYLKNAAAADSTRRLILAEYYTLAGRPDDAEALLEALLSDPNLGSQAKVRLGAMRYRAGRKEDAQRLVAEVLKAEPRNAIALALRARIYLGDGKLDLAAQDAQTAAAANPNSPAPLYLLAAVETERRSFTAALKAYNDILKLNPRAAVALVNQAKLSLRLGRIEPSVQLAEQAVRIAPRSADARIILTRALIVNGNLPRAERELAVLLKALPNLALVHETDGLLRLAKKDSRGARAAFERALASSPSSPLANQQLAGLDASANRHRDAEARLEKALASANGSNPQLTLVASDYYTRVKQFSKAEDLLRRVITTNPAMLEAYARLAGVLVSQEKLDEALEQFDTIAQRQSHSTPAATMAALILELQNKRAEAKKRYERILQLDPDAAVAANNLAWIYATDGGNLDTALQLAQTAKAALPNDPDVNDTIGWVYYMKDLPKMALPLLRASVERNPNHPSYQYHLGMACVKAGEYLEGRAALLKALQLNPGHPEASEIRIALALVDERVGRR